MKLYHLVHNRWGHEWHEELLMCKPPANSWKLKAHEHWSRKQHFILMDLIRNIVVATNFDVVQMGMYHTTKWPLKEALINGEELPRVTIELRYSRRRISYEESRMQKFLDWQAKLRERAKHIYKEVSAPTPAAGEPQLTNTKG